MAFLARKTERCEPVYIWPTLDTALLTGVRDRFWLLLTLRLSKMESLSYFPVISGQYKYLMGASSFWKGEEQSSLNHPLRGYHYCQTKKRQYLFLPSSLLFFQSLFVSLTISLSLFVSYSKELVDIELPRTNRWMGCWETGFVLKASLVQHTCSVWLFYSAAQVSHQMSALCPGTYQLPEP